MECYPPPLFTEASVLMTAGVSLGSIAPASSLPLLTVVPRLDLHAISSPNYYFSWSDHRHWPKDFKIFPVCGRHVLAGSHQGGKSWPNFQVLETRSARDFPPVSPPHYLGWDKSMWVEGSSVMQNRLSKIDDYWWNIKAWFFRTHFLIFP